MTLNFPDTPGNGEKYLAENGIEYTYNLANDTWTGALSAQNVPINPSPSDVSVDPPFGNPSGTNPGSGTLADPFIITDSIVPTLNGSTQSLQTITITSGKAGDQVVFTNNTTPLDISSKYTQPLGYIDANGKWIGKLVYNDSFGADTTSNTTYTGKLQCGTGTVYFQWNVQQQATPAMFVTAGTALTGTPVSGTDLGATQPTVTGGLSPYTYSYKWQTSNDNIAFTDIPSAITSSYSLTSANVGKYIRCIATVSDSSTIQAVTVSSTTATVNVVSIDVSLSTNQPQANQPIQASAVVLGGVAPVTTAYQWKADGVNIIGATSATYVVEVATDGKRLSCQITTTDAANTNAVKTSTQTDPVASGDVPEINTVTLAEVTPNTPDRFTDQSFTVAVDMTKDNPKSDYAIRGKVLGDLTVDVETSVITKLEEEESIDGTWNAASAAEANSWRAVTYGDGKFVAVSQSASNSAAMYSADGISWSLGLGSVIDSNTWVSVAYGNGKFVAVSGYGNIMYSSDGISWLQPTPSSSSNGLASVTYGNGKFVVVGSGGNDYVMYSTDGIIWTGASAAENNNWRGVTYGGDKFVAVASTGTNRVMYSADGISWTSASAAENNEWYGITYGDGKFVAVTYEGTNQVMYSTDGISWTGTTAAEANNWFGVTYGNGKFVATATTGTNRVMYSDDGISWTSALAPADSWYSVTYGNGKFVSVSKDGTNQVMWSYTGTGVADTTQVLTLTDTSGLSSINQGDVVVQNSGGTPVTTAITNVTNNGHSLIVSGLQAEFCTDLQNGVTSSNAQDGPGQPLSAAVNTDGIVPDQRKYPNFTGEAATAVFTYNPPVATTDVVYVYGGAFNNQSTRIDTIVYYSDGSQESIITYSGNNKWYWGIPFQTSGKSVSSVSIYADGYLTAGGITLGNKDFITANLNIVLTLTDDTNLANFRVGDVVQYTVVGAFLTGNAWPVTGNSDVYQDMTWADFTADQSIVYGPVTGYKPINAADTVTPGVSSVYRFEYVADSDQETYFLIGQNANTGQTMDVQGDVTNPGSQAITGDTSGSPSQIKIGLKQGVGAFTLEVNTGQVYCYGRSAFGSSGYVYKVTGINEATPSITTNGGGWSGTDGTGDNWNQSQDWSQNNTGFETTIAQASKAFNGSTDDSGLNRAYATAKDSYATVTFASALTVSTSLRVWVGSGPTQPNLLKINNNAISGSFPSVAGDWFTVPGISSLSSISVGRDNTGTYGNYTSLYAVEVDGQMLVDSGVVGAETSVTGPTQAAASGTVKLAGARETTATIQTSTITNVNPTVGITTQVPVGTTGDWDGILGVNPDGSTSGPVAIFPDGQGVDSPKGYIHYTNMTIGQTITLYATAGGTSARAVYGDVSESSVPDPGSSLTTITLTTTSTSGKFKIDWNVSANLYGITPGPGKTVLTLTDDTDLALFTPGDIVQQDTEGVISGTIQPVFGCTNPGNTDPSSVSYWENAFNGTTTGYGQVAVFNFGADYEYTDKVEVYMAGSGQSAKYATDGWVTNIPTETWTNITGGGTSTRYAQQISFENGNCTPANVGAVRIDGVILRLTAPDPTTVISTNLTTPSITTAGGAWTGSDGTSSGDVSNRQTKVTGPVKTIEVAGPYLTLSPSSGRWLVTETGYSALLKLNKFAKSSSVQSVASLFTVMDALGNVTDLTVDDPGYTNMVGDPTYTLTFPSVFPSGETPDVELPPGTKYQVEVKATNDVGVDNAFSNDVMPIAGLLQTSVITDNTLKPGGWNEVAAPLANNFTSIAYDGSGRFVAVSSDGIQRSMYSDDGGSSWAVVNMPGENLWSSVAYGNGYFVAVSRDGTPRAAYSSDATSWSGPAGNNTYNIEWYGVAYGAGSFVAVGSDGAMESTDNGASWSQRNYASSGVSGAWKSVVYGTPSTGANAGQGVFVAVSSGTTTMYSLNKGYDWIAGGATTGENFVSVAYNNGIFVAVAENSGSMYSTDGITWTASAADSTSAWRGVTYGGGKFVAVARSGTYRTMHSTDGMSWKYGEAIDSGWNAVVYGGDRYVSVSNDGNTMWSLYGNDSYTELTTVDNTNYNLFTAGDAVVESSGGTPVTSAITNVSTAPALTALYYFTGIPTNLADVTTNGVLVTPGLSKTTSQNLVAVVPAGAAPGYSVFSSDMGFAFSWGASDVGGHFQADGTRLGGDGSYNGNEAELIQFGTSADYDTFYRIPTVAAYTVFYNQTQTGEAADIADYTTLTFTNDTNLANFRVGDKVGGGSGFAPVIYTGNGTTQSISCGFSPDLVWIKNRTENFNHQLVDSVRGAASTLLSNATNSAVDSGVITSLDLDGFSINSDYSVNRDGQELVAWCWDAGDTTVTNTEGSVDAQVRSNGNFSIVKWASVGGTVTWGHGLNSAPKFVITKNLGDAGWYCYHEAIGYENYLILNTSDAAGASTWGAAPTDTLFTYGSNFTAGPGNDVIAYCWAESPTQNFGSYTGNSSTSGPIIDCGFEPAFVLVKNTSFGSTYSNWVILDNKRSPANPRQDGLFPNSSAAESTNIAYSINFNSTGFQLVTSDSETSGLNNSGNVYIYAAFASDTTITDINEAANQMTVEGGSFSPLVNSSRQWSDGVSSNNGGFGSSEQPEMGFDGLPDTKCKCQQNNAIITIAFSPAITVNKSLKLRYAGSGYGSGYIQIEANGTEVVDTPASGKAGTIIDIPFTGSLTSISIQEGSQNAGFSQIFVDGDVLMNGPWNTSKNWAASSGLNTSSRGPITLAFNGSIGDSVSEGINDSDTVVIGTNITINTSLQYWSYNTSGQSTTWRFKRASDGNIAVTTLNTADKNNYDYTTVPLPTESGHGLGVEYSQISAQRSTSSETISAIRLDGQVLVDPTTISVTEVTGPTFPPATGTILSTGTRITDKAIQTSTITNVGTAPWPLWNNTALNWSVTGTKTSYNNGGDVVTSALPTGSLLYTEFTIAATAVTKRLGVGFTDTPNSTSANQGLVGWYFNGSGGSKAVWTAGSDSNSSMGAGMGGLGQALYTKADYDAGVSSGSSYGAGDVLGYAIDPDGNVWVSKNGVYLATAGWYAAGNGSPVPGGSGYVSTINSDTRYFGAQYNGGQTFTISATGTYTPLQTSLTLTDDTDLAFFSYGDVVQVDGPPNTSLVYAQANDEDMGSYFNYFYASPEFQTAGWKITDFLDETLIGTSFTFSYFWSNDGVNWTKGGNYDSTSSPGAFPVDDSGYGAFTIYGQTGVGNAKISLTGVRYAGTVGTLPTANPFATDVSVTSTNLSTPSINTSGGDWIGTDGTGLNGKGGILNEFMSQSTFVSTTNASTLTYNQSLPGSLPATQAMVFRNGVTNIDVTYAFHVYSSTDGTNWTRVANKVNEPQTFSAPYLAVASDDQAAGNGTITGSAAVGEDKVTGPVKTITQSGPYITFSETTGRWLVTQSDYDAAKKLDTTVRVPLVLDASNTVHVALFNAMNTKFTAFPTARQTFIDALRTKIIGLTLTTPELEVLCGTAKTLVKRHEITIVGNKFYIDGVLQATLSLKKGTTYIFDQDEATNSGHTLKLYTDANKTTEYTSGVTVIGTPGGATSRTTFVVPSNAPAVLYYQSTAAASMGGQLNIS